MKDYIRIFLKNLLIHHVSISLKKNTESHQKKLSQTWRNFIMTLKEFFRSKGLFLTLIILLMLFIYTSHLHLCTSFIISITLNGFIRLNNSDCSSPRAPKKYRVNQFSQIRVQIASIKQLNSNNQQFKVNSSIKLTTLQPFHSSNNTFWNGLRRSISPWI